MTSFATLVRTVYYPQRKKNPATGRVDTSLWMENATQYSLARHALFYGLKALDLQKGDMVTLPAFICKDLLASLNKLELSLSFYHTDKKCEVELGSINPNAKALIFVNYFGFSPSLNDLQSFCQRKNIVMIEDNAHGFLSKDELGRWLGTRGDIAIFSVRKTFPLQNGAFLKINNPAVIKSRPFKIDFSLGNPWSKSLLRPIAFMLGGKNMMGATHMYRSLKKLRTGHAITPSGDKCEHEIPDPIACVDFPKALIPIDMHQEIQRRRHLFESLASLLKEAPVQLVFDELPAGVSPYALAFYCADKNISTVAALFKKWGLDFFKWPDLPTLSRDQGRDYYHQLYLVRFLW